MRKVRIILGIIIILGGFGGIVSGEVLPATFCILGGISLIPAIYEKSKLNNKLLQIILPIVLLSIFGSMVSTKDILVKINPEDIATAEQARKVAEEQARKQAQEEQQKQQAIQQSKQQKTLTFINVFYYILISLTL